MIIRDLETDDIGELTKISSDELGSDYLTSVDFSEAMHSPDVFCKVGVNGERPAGFCICRIFGPEDADRELKLPDSPQRDEIMKHRKIGLIDSVSVLGEAKGKGIGFGMVESSYKELIRRGCDIIACVAWKSILGTTNIARILTDGIGMTPVLSMEGYWNGMVSNPSGHDCPLCGRPCKCSAVLYVKRI